MSDLYNSNPANYGGFAPSIIGSSTNRGFYQAPQGLPHSGKEASIDLPPVKGKPCGAW